MRSTSTWRRRRPAEQRPVAIRKRDRQCRPAVGQRRLSGQGSGHVVEGIRKRRGELEVLIAKANTALNALRNGSRAISRAYREKTMDWNSRRVEALLEQALDRGQGDERRNHCSHVDPRPARNCHGVGQAGLCTLAGIGCIPRFLASLRNSTRKRSTIRNRQSSGNVRWSSGSQGAGHRRHPSQRPRAARLRTGDSESDAADERHCDHDSTIRG